MKILCSILLMLSVILWGVSCQKEFSYEGGDAKGHLQKTLTGDCSPITVTGRYQKDTFMKAATNYIDIQVNISRPGRYFIKTDTLNGYSFSTAGVFTLAGLHIIHLLALGKPLAASLDVFTVKFDTSICQFNIVVTGNGGGTSTVAAKFTFNCTLAASAGNYQQGVPTTAANIITLPVTVTAGGSYDITTSNNGVTFSGSGILTTIPSVQTITLAATVNNVPTVPGLFNYTINAGGSAACDVNIIYTSASLFATDSIVATIDSVYTTFKSIDSAKLDNTSIPGYGGIRIKGANPPGDETFNMDIARLGNVIAAGTYTINNYPASINVTKYSTATANFSRTTNFIPGMLQNYGFTIIITAVTATKVTGTFSGRLLDAGVGPVYKTVTDGIFSVTIFP